MRIAATTTNGGLDDIVTPQFGRTASFTILDLDYDGKIRNVEIVENTAALQSSGAGIAASQMLVDKKVEVLLTGNIGPKALNVLRAAGIRIFRADGLRVRDAVEMFARGELEGISSADTGRGMGGGKGFGGGRGMGMGGGRWR